MSRFRSIALLILLALPLVGCELARPEDGSPEPAAIGESVATAPVERPSPVATPPGATPVPPTLTPLPPTATAEPVAAAEPSPEPSPEPTQEPVARLRQLTSGGCCTQPFWSPGSDEVRFIDRPPGGASGIWGVPLAGGAPRLVSEQIGALTPEGEYVIETGPLTAVIERVADGQTWEFATAGDTPSISPGGERVAWDVRDRGLPFDQQVAEIWVAPLEGGEPRRVLDLPRGGVRGWLTDDRLLLSGREREGQEEEYLMVLSVESGAITELARAERMSGESLSPGRRWLIYYSVLSADPSENGLWLLDMAGGETRRLPDELFGAYRWRDDGRLLVVPFDPDATAHEFWEIEAASGEARRLTDPSLLPFKIANGDWSVAPDGDSIAFVEARDDNIWLLELP